MVGSFLFWGVGNNPCYNTKTEAGLVPRRELRSALSALPPRDAGMGMTLARVMPIGQASGRGFGKVLGAYVRSRCHASGCSP